MREQREPGKLPGKQKRALDKRVKFIFVAHRALSSQQHTRTWDKRANRIKSQEGGETRLGTSDNFQLEVQAQVEVEALKDPNET
jgi:hypothetical protein